MLWSLFILQAWRLWYVAVSNELHEKVWVQTPEPLAQRQQTYIMREQFPQLDQEEEILLQLLSSCYLIYPLSLILPYVYSLGTMF